MKSVGKSASGKRDRGSGFVYKERSVDAVKSRAERTGGRFDSPISAKVDTFKPKVGDNMIRIMPPTWDDHDHYGYQVFVHTYIGPDNSNYLCLRKMKGERCAICEEHQRARAAGEQEEAKALEPKEQFWCWSIDRDGDEKDPTPQVYILSWTADRDIAALCYSNRTGKAILIDHPDKGYDLIIKRTGQGLKTRYQYQIDRDPTPLHDDEGVQDRLLDWIQDNPIPSVLNFYDNDYLEKVLVGEVKQKDPDNEEGDDEPRSRRRSRDEEDEPAPRRRSRDAEDEPEEPRSRRSREEPEEEEPAPRRRSRDAEEEPEEPRSRRSRDKEDEPEDPPARRRSRDAEEEPEEPRRRSRDEEDEPRSRRSTRDKEDEPEDPPRRRRGEEEEEPASGSSRVRRAAKEEEPEEEEPRRRSSSRAKEEEPEEEPRRRRR